MRLLEILVLVGICLAFVKAESDADTEFDELLKDQPADKSFTEDEAANTAEDAPLKEDSKEKRQFSRPLFYLSIGVPSNVGNSASFNLCYCFRRRCYVPGMRPGFKGWITVGQSGYVVINNWLYSFYWCSPKPVYPRPTPSRVYPRPTVRPSRAG